MYIKDVSVWLLRLITIAEAHWDFKPFPAGEGPPWSDRLYIDDDQALRIHDAFPVMDAEKISACLDSLRVICLIFIFLSALFNFHV